MLQLLLTAGGLYLVLGDLAEALILLAFAVLNVVLVAVQEGHVHDEHCEHDSDEDDHDHKHDDGIKSVALTLHRPIDRRKIARWLTALVKNQGQDILRAKGIIDVKDNDRRLVFQAVHMILEGDLQRAWREGELRYSRMVFIGRNLDQAELKAGFESCAA